jgi:sugar-specific transcriptional regulator TrmB
MYEELLKECGLTQNESLVYLTLLRIGMSKSGRIVKEAKTSGGKIYETLYKLIDKGLVKSVEENGVKQFIANDPETLLSYMKEKQDDLKKKETELEKYLPTLKSLKGFDDKYETVSLVKGTRGVSALVYAAIEKGNSVRVMGVRSSKLTHFNNFWKNWHKHRVDLGKNAKMIFSDGDSDYYKFYKGLKLTEVRVIPSFTPSAIMLIDDSAFLFSYEDDLVCIHIQQPSIAKSFSTFFDEIWSIAK